MKWREAEKGRGGWDGMGNPTTKKRYALPSFPHRPQLSRPFLYDDTLIYGLSTMTRSNVGVVVEMTGSSVWVIDVADAK